jgi:hypothetical protein
MAMAIGAAGCTQAVRVRTAGFWSTPGASGQGIPVHYFAYWEGQCGGYRNLVPYMSRCSTGAAHVRRCIVNADNTVQCFDEQSLDSLLISTQKEK